jgi:hypothetical protein
MIVAELIAGISAFIYAVTAVFIILYWKETQRMKNKMIEQIELSKKQLKSSTMPVLDAIIESVKPDPAFAQYPMQFCYDIFLINKGSGPAFKISIQRIPSDTRGQKEALRGAPVGQIDHFQKSINIIGINEKVLVHREHSDSYKAYTLKILFRDIFGDRYTTEFSGDRDGLALNNYDVMRIDNTQ